MEHCNDVCKFHRMPCVLPSGHIDECLCSSVLVCALYRALNSFSYSLPWPLNDVIRFVACLLPGEQPHL
jgi:hypothetical protein